MGIVEKKIGGGGHRCGSRKNCVAEGEGAAGGETKDEMGVGGKGKMPTGINCSMVVVVNDGLWISSITVIHNAGHWEFFIFNSRRCERRPLNFAKSRRSQRWPLPPCSTTH